MYAAPVNTPESGPYESLSALNPDAVVYDGFEGAYIGYVETKGSEPIACYDWRACVDILIRQGCTEEEALEWMSYNVTEAYVGEHTPCFLYRE